MRTTWRNVAATTTLVSLLAGMPALAADPNLIVMPVAQGHWAQQTVAQLIQEGLLVAPTDGDLALDATLSVADVAQVLHQMAGVAPGEGDLVASAEAKGWIKATDLGQTELDQTAPVTREVFALWTARAINLGPLAENARMAMRPTFADAEAVQPALRNAVYVLQEQGIIAGNPEGHFQPQRAITRAEALQMLWKAHTTRQNRSLKELGQELEGVAASGWGTPIERIQALLTFSNQRGLELAKEGKALLQADLNGDGTPEIIAAINDRTSAIGNGGLFVLTTQDSTYQLATSQTKEYQSIAIHGTADLNGDGQVELVWSATSMGANTAFSEVYASTWTADGLVNLPGEVKTTYMSLGIDGQELVVKGGLVGGWGSGKVQRPSTQRYRWVDGSLKLVDQRYEASTYGYHLLQDGIVAEQFGRTADAEQAYRTAMAPETTPLFSNDDTLAPAMEGRFGDAVRSMARFRLGHLLLAQGQVDEAKALLTGAEGQYAGLAQALLGADSLEAGLAAATEWAKANPDFLEALNAPRGYVNPQWSPANLGEALPK